MWNFIQPIQSKRREIVHIVLPADLYKALSSLAGDRAAHVENAVKLFLDGTTRRTPFMSMQSLGGQGSVHSFQVALPEDLIRSLDEASNGRIMSSVIDSIEAYLAYQSHVDSQQRVNQNKKARKRSNR
jgi:hypothetical protein